MDVLILSGKPRPEGGFLREAVARWVDAARGSVDRPASLGLTLLVPEKGKSRDDVADVGNCVHVAHWETGKDDVAAKLQARIGGLLEARDGVTARKWTSTVGAAQLCIDHARVLHHAQAVSHAEYVTVVEDDVLPTRTFVDAMEYALASVSQGEFPPRPAAKGAEEAARKYETTGVAHDWAYVKPFSAPVWSGFSERSAVGLFAVVLVVAAPVAVLARKLRGRWLGSLVIGVLSGLGTLVFVLLVSRPHIHEFARTFMPVWLVTNVSSPAPAPNAVAIVYPAATVGYWRDALLEHAALVIEDLERGDADAIENGAPQIDLFLYRHAKAIGRQRLLVQPNQLIHIGRRSSLTDRKTKAISEFGLWFDE